MLLKCYVFLIISNLCRLIIESFSFKYCFCSLHNFSKTRLRQDLGEVHFFFARKFYILFLLLVFMKKRSKVRSSSQRDRAEKFWHLLFFLIVVLAGVLLLLPFLQGRFTGKVVDTPVCPSVVGYWKFDAFPQTDFGVVEDGSGFNQPGSVQTHEAASGNSNKAVSGLLGNALSFDGVDDFVSVPHDPRLDPGTGSFSISLWVKPTQTQSSRILFKNGGNGVTF